MQQLPVGWVNPHTTLVLGAGAVIDPAILEREFDMVTAATGEDVRTRTFIDPRAWVHLPEHAELSKMSGRHHLMGATGKGCSEAVMHRIHNRGSAVDSDSGVGNFDDFVNSAESTSWLDGVRLIDTERMLNEAVDAGARIQLEGCQGTLLDLYLGPYPYVTHKQTTAAQWLSECGLSPALDVSITMVVRTYPIRVAGNSGPLASEISWPELARIINAKRSVYGLGEIVHDSMIREFEQALSDSERQFRVPEGFAFEQHQLTSDKRVLYAKALSELNKAALSKVSHAALTELRRLFEFTTVTKKLRRVARLSSADLRVAARQVRPAQIAVTFMNYEFPHRWGGNEPATTEERDWLRENVEIPCNAPVTLINRGPAMADIVQVTPVAQLSLPLG